MTDTFDLPAELAPTSQDSFDLVDNNAVYFDARTNTSLRQMRSGPRWSVSWRYENLCESRRKALQALRARLKGSINSVRLFDYADTGSLGQVGGELFDDGLPFDDGLGFDDGNVVSYNGADAGAASLWVGFLGLAADNTEPLKAGDKIGFLNDRLHMVVEDVTVDDQILPNVFNVKIWPPLAEDVTSGDAITCYRPTGRFFLQQSGAVATSTEKLSSASLTFIEEVRT